MAWSIPSSSDFISETSASKSVQILTELATAVNERQTILGITNTSFPTITSLDWLTDITGTYISTLRTAIEALRRPSTTNINLWGKGATYTLSNQSGFVKSDFTAYANFAAVLTAAGYPSGWITDYSVANHLIFVQFQDVLDELTTYMWKGRNEPQSNTYYASDPKAGFDLAWNDLIADPNANPGTTPSVFFLIELDSGAYTASRRNSVTVNFDFSAKPGTPQATDFYVYRYGDASLTTNTVSVSVDGTGYTINSSTLTSGAWISHSASDSFSIPMSITSGTPATNPFTAGLGGSLAEAWVDAARTFFLLSAGDGLTYG